MVKLVFTDQYANLLFLVNGLAILFYIGARKKKRQRAMKFGNYETLQKVAGRNFLKSSNIILIARITALTALIIGISNPVIVKQAPSTDTDYVLAIDSSSSMLSPDLEPTRLDAAKEISKSFIERLKGDSRLGIISFSGEVRTESELASGKENLKAAVDQIEIGDTAGTAIGDAVFSSSSMLLESNQSRKVILITDGRNNAGSSLNESIAFAERHNVTVTAVAIGKNREGGQNFGTVNGVNASRADFPNIDTSRLNRTVSRTGGRMVTVTNSTGLRQAFLSFNQSETRNDISVYFIFLALFLMLAEWILGTTKYSILP